VKRIDRYLPLLVIVAAVLMTLSSPSRADTPQVTAPSAPIVVAWDRVGSPLNPIG